MMKKHIGLLLAAAIVALTACNGNNSGTPAPTSTPAPVATATPAPVATATPAPTDTPAPTSAPSSQEAFNDAVNNPQPPASSTTVTLIAPYYSTDVPTTDAIQKVMAGYTGYNFSIDWVPSDAYGDKIAALLASDSLPMITVIPDLKSLPYITAVQNGQFWNLDDYFSKYCPNLQILGDVRLKNGKYDGNLYAIPRARELVRQGIIYRKDWATQLGIPEPKTIDDIDKLARGMATLPGVKYGAVGVDFATGPMYMVQELAIYEGAPNNYGLDSNGNFTFGWLTPEYTKAVDLVRSWYADGLVNKDFMESIKAEKYMNTEEAGLIFAYADNIYGRYGDLATKNPNAQLWFQLNINNRAIATAGYNGGLVFSKTAVKDEKTLIDCLTFENSLATELSESFIYSGIPGTDYTVGADGVWTQTSDQADHMDNTVGQYAQIRCVETLLQGIYQKWAPTTDPYDAEFKAQRKVAMALPAGGVVADMSSPFISDTLTKSGADLLPIMMDAINKYITGDITLDQYKAAQQQWLDTGGQKVIDEYKAQYDANK